MDGISSRRSISAVARVVINMPEGGSDNPSTRGTHYDSNQIQSANEPQRVIPEGIETGSYAVYAVTVSGDYIYLGWDEDVTTSDGFPLQEDRSFTVDLSNESQPLYMVSANSGDEVRVIALD